MLTCSSKKLSFPTKLKNYKKTKLELERPLVIFSAITEEKTDYWVVETKIRAKTELVFGSESRGHLIHLFILYLMWMLQ